jgi:BirA family biotin operon repressor/biotin-[acetyl-CoA-carboxylase] ligase
VLGHPTIVHAVTTSTNDDARALAAKGAAHGTLVVADAQSAGRGRRGRTWSSPAGENLYASFVLRLDLSPSIAPTLALVAGLAVAEAVAPFAGAHTPRVKWPNDVRAAHRKLAGLLVEGSLRGDTLAWVVLGVGINVGGTRAPGGLDDIATTLTMLSGKTVSRAAVLASLCGALEARIDTFARHGFDALRNDVAERCETLGTRVRIDGVEGKAIAIANDGALVLRTDAGATVHVHVGDVAPAA